MNINYFYGWYNDIKISLKVSNCNVFVVRFDDLVLAPKQNHQPRFLFYGTVAEIRLKLQRVDQKASAAFANTNIPNSTHAPGNDVH